MKYVLEKSKPETEVIVSLSQQSDGIHLIVGRWHVFVLNTDGTGHLSNFISDSNDAGIQTNSQYYDSYDAHIKLV